MAERLRSDGQPLDVVIVNRWSPGVGYADVDFVDTALELNVPVADPEVTVQFDLGAWARNPSNDKTAKDRPRDPVILADDEAHANAKLVCCETHGLTRS